MKNIRPADASPLNSIITLAVAVLLLTACGIFSGGNRSNSNSGSGGNRSGGNNSSNVEATGWKVWVKTSPCAGGRTDWISVARTNPTEGGGGSFWQTADLILNPMPCTLVSDDSCTFAQADASANVIRASGRFTGYCCRTYSVWRNSATGRMSIVSGKYSTAGHGWDLETPGLCCEEAVALSGIPNACSGPQAPPLGNTPTAGRTPGNSNTTTTTGAVDDGADDFEGTVWFIPGEFATLSIFKVKPDNSVEAGNFGDNEIRWTGTYKNKRLELQNPYYAGSVEYERLEATVNGSSMTGNHRYKVYTDKSDEPFTGYCINCWVNWTTFGLIGGGGIVLIGGGIWLRRRMKKRRVKPVGEKPAPVKEISAEEKPDKEKEPSADASSKKIRLSRRCSRCSQIVRAGNTSCPACGTSL